MDGRRRPWARTLQAGAKPIEEQMLHNASTDPKIITGRAPRFHPTGQGQAPPCRGQGHHHRRAPPRRARTTPIHWNSATAACARAGASLRPPRLRHPFADDAYDDIRRVLRDDAKMNQTTIKGGQSCRTPRVPAVSSTVGLKNMVIAPLTEDTEEAYLRRPCRPSPGRSRRPSPPRRRPRRPVRRRPRVRYPLSRPGGHFLHLHGGHPARHPGDDLRQRHRRQRRAGAHIHGQAALLRRGLHVRKGEPQIPLRLAVQRCAPSP